MSLLWRSVVLCLLVLVVSASLTERILRVPLFEVGELWVNSVQKLYGNVLSYVVDFCDVYSPVFYVGMALVGFVGYHLYQILFAPYNRIVTLGELGYQPDGKFTKKEIANRVKRWRKVGEIPPVYPNGWFGVIESWRQFIQLSVPYLNT